MTRQLYCRKIFTFVIFALLLVALYKPVAALSPGDPPSPVIDSANHLVRFCIDPKVRLNDEAIGTLVDYVMASKEKHEYPLPKSREAGAYYEFDTKTQFPRFINYSYSSLIPQVMTRPSSLRYSVWTSPGGGTQRLPDTWKPVPPGGAPVVVRGFQRDANSPDLHTGVYHEYDLKTTLIHLNHKGRQVLVSVSKQIKQSNVGKKGVILGNDSDWTYYYSGEPGTPKAGLGWVKSYIYDYYSVVVYVESGSAPAVVRTGIFQWLRAGWSGINFVQSNHILGGIQRFARNFRMILESPRLPAPQQVSVVYQSLLSLPPDDLTERYAALQHTLRVSAAKIGKISKAAVDDRLSFAGTPREQMVEELMLEYLKTILGKPTVLGKHFSLAPPTPSS